MYAGLYADPHALAAYATAVAKGMDLPIREEWWPGILSYLGLALTMADRVGEAEVGPVEVAEVFVP